MVLGCGSQSCVRSGDKAGQRYQESGGEAHRISCEHISHAEGSTDRGIIINEQNFTLQRTHNPSRSREETERMWCPSPCRCSPRDSRGALPQFSLQPRDQFRFLGHRVWSRDYGKSVRKCAAARWDQSRKPSLCTETTTLLLCSKTEIVMGESTLAYFAALIMSSV